MSLPGVDLQGKAALVLGGGRGVGGASADALASAGAEVMVVDSDADDLARVAARLSVKTLKRDFSAPENAAETVSVAQERLGGLDVLVCAQARLPGPVAFAELSLDEFRRIQAANLTYSFAAVQAAAKAMAAAGGGGRIVIVIRPDADAAGGASVAFELAQAGLRDLVRSAAIELAQQRTTVNGVASCWMHAEAGGIDPAPELRPSPIGVAGEPEDAARAVLWFADPDNAFVTGTVISVDGGQAAMRFPADAG
jgi:NAD(P)-dependent dehydrogenase (short-subunit alcohol dehydrogenase family)